MRQAHQESLGLIVAMMGEEKMARARLAGGRQHQPVARGASRGLDPARRPRSFPGEHARRQPARGRNRRDVQSLLGGTLAQAVIDGEHDSVGPPAVPPPAIEAIEKGERIGSAGDGERDAPGFGYGGEKRVELAVGNRCGRLSSSHWPVQPRSAGGARSTSADTA